MWWIFTIFILCFCGVLYLGRKSFFKVVKKDHLLRERFPWLTIIAPGCVILNKNGSLQQTFAFRGPDLDAVTPMEVDITVKKVNNILRRRRGGWAIFADVQRITSMNYPESTFPDPVSAMIDEERRLYFQQGEHFECRYYLTLQWLPPSDHESKLKDLFIESPIKRRHANYKQHLVEFQQEVDRVYRMLNECLPDIQPLTNDETLTFLHDCVSPKRHPVKAIDANRIDYQITDTPLTPGFHPILGDYHLRTVSILQFPNMSEPGIFDILNRLDFEYRWTTRFIPIDKQDAMKIIKEFTRKWFNNRQSALDIIKSIFTQEISVLQNTDSLKKSRDSDVAAQELAAEAVSFGYYTMTVTVMDRDVNNVEKKVRRIEEIINSRGFTAIVETYNAVDAWFGSLPGISGSNLRTPILSSLNLTHLFPLADKWAGPTWNKRWDGPPLIYAQTNDSSPFRFDLHTNGEVGHALVVGPTGAGKSFILALMAAQSRRYPGSQCFFFDKGGSIRALTAGLGGDFFDLGHEEEGALSFQPLARLDQPNEIEWALEWVLQLCENEGIEVTPSDKNIIWEALLSVQASSVELRRMSTLYTHIMDERLKEVIFNYTEKGPYGKLFDAASDALKYNPFQVFEMEVLMETKESVVEPALSYIFHRLDSYFSEKTPIPTLLFLDEAWTYLKSESFKNKIGQWLRELRKKKVDVVFATQSLDEIEKSSISSVIIDSCQTKIYLPNPEAIQPKQLPLYRSFGLNDREIEIISEAAPQREYFFTSPKGRRLMEFGAEYCPFSLAYIAASSKEDQAAVIDILKTHGKKGFNQEWLRYKNMKEYLEIFKAVERKVS